MNSWTTKDGKQIKIIDLTLGHLKAIIAMLNRKGWVHSGIALQCLDYACDSSTPDGAAREAEIEYENCKFSAPTDAIFEEANKRGLK